MKEKHIHPIFDRLVSTHEREQFLNQKAKVFWLTGLSGSGKSTIASAVERVLFNKGYFVQVLDGDNTRTGLCNNLGFSLEDRKENIRRIAELSKLYNNSGIVCINSFVSPTHEIRHMAKDIIGEDKFQLVYVEASVEVCESRDVKGLYKLAREGKIKGFTGIDSPFEAPTDAQLIVKTSEESLEQSANKVIDFILPQISL